MFITEAALGVGAGGDALKPATDQKATTRADPHREGDLVVGAVALDINA